MWNACLPKAFGKEDGEMFVSSERRMGGGGGGRMGNKVYWKNEGVASVRKRRESMTGRRTYG